MKSQILKISKDLESGKINTEEAKKFLSDLLDSVHISISDGDYDFNFFHRRGEGGDSNDLNNKPMGGFSDW